MLGGEALAGGGNAFNDTASQRSVYSCSNSVSVMHSTTSALNSGYFNVQRLLRQEKGEDVYYSLMSNARMQESLDIYDVRRRRNVLLEATHFTFEEDKEGAALQVIQAKWQNEQQLKSKREEESKVRGRLVRYELGRSVGSIANFLEGFMEVCDRSQTKAITSRVRAYSQENLASSRAEGIGFDEGPEERNALSQMVEDISALGDVTESED